MVLFDIRSPKEVIGEGGGVQEASSLHEEWPLPSNELYLKVWLCCWSVLLRSFWWLYYPIPSAFLAWLLTELHLLLAFSRHLRIWRGNFPLDFVIIRVKYCSGYAACLQSMPRRQMVHALILILLILILLMVRGYWRLKNYRAVGIDDITPEPLKSPHQRRSPHQRGNPPAVLESLGHRKGA